MYRGFKTEWTPIFNDHNETAAAAIYKTQKESIKRSLESYIKNDSIKAEDLIKDWFPTIQADVFISHSHTDEAKAISFANWLKRWFGLTSFIDSTVWGNARELLQDIHTFCKQTKNEAGTITYDFNESNRACELINMMLSTSLSKMLDNCECVFFLETPNSIKPQSAMKATDPQTGSPWLYHELSCTELLRIKEPIRHTKVAYATQGKEVLIENRSIEITFPARTRHLSTVTDKQLAQWNVWAVYNRYPITKEDALDKLYELAPIQSS